MIPMQMRTTRKDDMFKCLNDLVDLYVKLVETKREKYIIGCTTMHAF